jgi:hypothetical protein
MPAVIIDRAPKRTARASDGCPISTKSSGIGRKLSSEDLTTIVV